MKSLCAFCPVCGLRSLQLIRWIEKLPILKPRSWVVCTNCDYEYDVIKMKKMLCSV